jgi:hypothetical protein
MTSSPSKIKKARHLLDDALRIAQNFRDNHMRLSSSWPGKGATLRPIDPAIPLRKGTALLIGITGTSPMIPKSNLPQ